MLDTDSHYMRQFEDQTLLLDVLERVHHIVALDIKNLTVRGNLLLQKLASPQENYFTTTSVQPDKPQCSKEKAETATKPPAVHLQEILCEDENNEDEETEMQLQANHSCVQDVICLSEIGGKHEEFFWDETFNDNNKH